jgi:hypothetical protein
MVKKKGEERNGRIGGVAFGFVIRVLFRSFGNRVCRFCGLVRVSVYVRADWSLKFCEFEVLVSIYLSARE